MEFIRYNKLEDFTVLLSEFYSTNDNSKIKQFVYDCKIIV